MAYSKEELFERLKEVIKKDYKHKYYDHTVKQAIFWKSIMTGDFQDDLVVAYKPSENEPQKKQRIRLYNSRTAYAAQKIVSTFKEVERIEEISDKISFIDKDLEPEDLIKRLENYEGRFKKYIHDAVRRLNFYDPNAWIVTEFFFKEGDSKPYAYPLEVHSDCAIDFEKKYNELQYLIICNTVKVLEPSNVNNTTTPYLKTNNDYVQRDGKQWTIYGIGWSIRITEYFDGPTTLDVFDIENKKYTYEEFNTKFNTVPAIQVGYIKDAETDWNTFQSPLYSAKHIFRDLINTKAEYDLAKALHGFIQKFAFAERCTHIERTDESTDKCNGGTMMISGQTCPSCHGSGKKIHTTVQDVILVTLPSDKSEHIPLSEYIYYQEIPKHIIDGYKQDLKDLEIDVSLAIFNKDTFSQAEVATTATEIRLNKQSVYNVLYEFALCVEYCYKELALQAADVLDIRPLIKVEFTLPKDFQMENMDDLITQRKNAVTASMPYDAIAGIDRKILLKQYQDNKELVFQILAQDAWRPFKDKTESERISIMSMLDPNDFDRILYIYFDKVFTEIWMDPKFSNFHKLSYLVQKKVVEDKVNMIIASNK